MNLLKAYHPFPIYFSSVLRIDIPVFALNYSGLLSLIHCTVTIPNKIIGRILVEPYIALILAYGEIVDIVYITHREGILAIQAQVISSPPF